MPDDPDHDPYYPMEEESKALAEAITEYVTRAATEPELRRKLLEFMTPEDQANLELLMEWLDPEDVPHKSPSHGG